MVSSGQSPCVCVCGYYCADGCHFCTTQTIDGKGQLETIVADTRFVPKWRLFGLWFRICQKIAREKLSAGPETLSIANSKKQPEAVAMLF